MSYDATDWAIPKRIPDVNAKSCLVVLAFHLNPKTGLCCPSVKTIMSEMGVKSVNTVRKSIRFLEEQDLISYSRVTNSRGEILRTEYVLNLANKKFDSNTADDESQVVTEGHDMTGGHQVTEGHDMTEGGSCGAVGVGHYMSDVGHDITPNKQINKQISNKKDNKEEKTTRGTRLTLTELPVDWREFAEREEPDLDPERLFENFRDYWTGLSGSKAIKKDWTATWRNSVRSYHNAEDWKRRPMLRKEVASQQASKPSRYFQEKKQEERHYELW